MQFLSDESSRIIAPLPGIIIVEVRLMPDHKVSVCHQLNKLIKEVQGANYQIILSVQDDDKNRYARLISRGIKVNEMDTDRLNAAVH